MWGAGHYLYEQQDAAPVRCYAASSLQVIPLPRPDMLTALGWSDRRLALDSGGLVNKQPSSGAPCLFRKSTTPNERLGTPDLPAPCVMWPRGTARRARKKPQNSRSKKRRWLGHVIHSSRCLGVVWLAVEPHPRPRPPWPLLFLLSSASLYPLAGASSSAADNACSSRSGDSPPTQARGPPEDMQGAFRTSTMWFDHLPKPHRSRTMASRPTLRRRLSSTSSSTPHRLLFDPSHPLPGSVLHQQELLPAHPLLPD